MEQLSERKQKNRRRFLTRGAQRTQNVLKALRTLSKVGNRAIYEYRDDEIERMFAAIDAQVAATKKAFRRKQEEPEPFSFDDAIE